MRFGAGSASGSKTGRLLFKFKSEHKMVELLTIEEIAKAEKVSPATVRKWTKVGDGRGLILPAIHHSKRLTRIRKDDYEAFARSMNGGEKP